MRIRLSVPFHLDHTLNSGQVFRWKKVGDRWEGIVTGKKISLFQKNAVVECDCDRNFLFSYFRLDDNLDEILSSLDKDEIIHPILMDLWGLRIIRQDPWECLISFIISAFNNVPRIKHIIETLSKTYGDPSGSEFTFPSPHSLATASLGQLRACGLGYRDKFVQTTAQIIDSGFPLQSLSSMNYRDAKKSLLRFPGVGHKVADCVLLFSLEKLEAFPCDVNIKTCIRHLYPHCSDINTFGRDYFGAYAGYANHYLYHYQRLKKNR